MFTAPYLTGIILVVVVDFLYCLVCLREILLHKKNQNMEEIQGGHCPCSKMQGGQPTILPPPCRAPVCNLINSCSSSGTADHRVPLYTGFTSSTSSLQLHLLASETFWTGTDNVVASDTHRMIYTILRLSASRLPSSTFTYRNYKINVSEQMYMLKRGAVV